MASSTHHHFEPHSEDYVKDVRIRFREQAARFLEDVSFDVGAVLARDLSLQDEDTKFRLSELQKGLSEQVQHMQKVIKKDKSILVASTVHRHKKEIHFTQTELKTLHEIAKQENDANGVVTMFLKRREEGVARHRYQEFLKRAEAKFFEHRRDGRRGKFDFRHIIRDSMRQGHQGPAAAEPKPIKAQRVPKLKLPGAETAPIADSAVTSATADTPAASIRSAPAKATNVVSARPASHRSTLRSARWSPTPKPLADPVDDEIRLIVDELAETVELLVDFEHQPFQTAVPPQYPFYPSRPAAVAAPQSVPESGERSIAGSDDGRLQDDDDDDDVLGEAVAVESVRIASESNDEVSETPDAKAEESLKEDHADRPTPVSTVVMMPISNDSVRHREESESEEQPEAETDNDEQHRESEVLEIMQEALAAELEAVVASDLDDKEPEPASPPDLQPEPAALSATTVTVAVEKAKSHVPRIRPAALRFMGPKRSQADLVQRCHRKNRESKASLPNPRRHGHRSRSPWRYPERFPQIRELQATTPPKKPAPGKPLVRTHSTTRLPKAH